MNLDITSILSSIGIYSETWISIIKFVTVLVGVSIIGMLTYLIAKKFLAKLILRIVGKTAAVWDDLMFDQRFFNRLGMFIAPLVVRFTISTMDWEHIGILLKIADVWILFAGVMLLSTILDGLVRIYDTYSRSKDRPIKVLMQVVMIFVYCAAIMVTISIFTEKSIAILLGGLAAFAAVLMLVFQDSILGFVAGIQFSANNMVRVGDWIVMPSRGIDGDVIEINLTTVKVQNFDKTITTVPTYKLVSESFTNWRGMEESGGRRIKRSVNIDVSSIRYLNETDIQRLLDSALLKEYIQTKLDEINDYNSKLVNPLDQRHLTNVGTFREYLESWIANNSKINQSMTHMVRQLQPGPTGLPVEIYCFAADNRWIAYENVQSDIFDHIYSVMPLFGLKAFQYSGGVAGSEN